MLITAKFLSKGVQYERTFNTNNIIYMDAKGVLFDADSHAMFAPGEYDRVKELVRQAQAVRVTVAPAPLRKVTLTTT